MSKSTHSIHLKSLSSLLLVTLLLSGCGNDDESTEPGSLAFSSDVYSVMENAGNVILQVERIGGSSGSVSVDYTSQNGTAIAGDYLSVAGTLNFPDRVTSQDIAIQIIDDTYAEGTETFSVTLSNPIGGATLLSPSSATVAIVDDESTPLYDFEWLMQGIINGQDNWVEPVTNASVVTDTSSVNGTQVVRPNTSVDGSAGDTQLTRVNNVGFSFPALNQIEGQSCFDTTADDNSLFALGRDINLDGMLNALDNEDEIGVPFGIWERQFVVFTGNSLSVRAGVAELSEDDLATDWYRICLTINFDANNGDGAGSLSYKNLSQGDSSFTEIIGLQDLDLRLIRNGAPPSSDWNAMFLLLRIDATNVPKVDNLMPNVPIVIP
jgi:hypothetical protein